MSHTPHVVLAATEAVPLAKAGGLADVTSALAEALAGLGCDVTLILPAYGFIERQTHGLRPRAGFSGSVPVGSDIEPVRLLDGTLSGGEVRLLLVEHEGFFGRDGIYSDPVRGEEYADAAQRWVYLSRAVLAALPALGRAPDILHLNDYHVALSALYRNLDLSNGNALCAQTGVVLALHNLGYQGIYPADRFALTGLPPELMYSMGALEFWGSMNFLKAGLVHADLLTTVSPTYAREIQEASPHGSGLEGVLRERGDDLVGILNGIDTRVWDPATDPTLPARYDATTLGGKSACKRALQERSGLHVETDVPVFGMISRLVHQKGIDPLLEALPAMLKRPLQVVVLGRGHPDYEKRLESMARLYPGRLSVQLDFDDAMAHWIEAGSDFFLMPSLYEPCGLNQMYSQKYGTLPLVRKTGGLADTVEPWNPETGEGTGFVFEHADVQGVRWALGVALEAWNRPEVWRKLRQNAMAKDFSWDRRGAEYVALYERVFGG